MYYEINVVKNKTHFFATAPRSITTQRDLREKLAVFIVKFPKEEGYELSVSYEKCTGTQYSDDALTEFLNGAELN